MRALNGLYDPAVASGGLISEGELVAGTSAASIALRGLAKRLDETILSRDSPSPQEAAEALLRARLSYTGEEAANLHVASYVQGRVALPRRQGEATMLTSLLDDEAAAMVRSFESSVMYIEEEWENIRGDLPSFVPLMDRVLSSDAAKYHSFVGDLWDHHIVGFTQTPLQCVLRRLIADPRGCNQRCRAPPHMPLGGPATWSRLTLPPGATVHIAAAGVESYFFS